MSNIHNLSPVVMRANPVVHTNIIQQPIQLQAVPQQYIQVIHKDNNKELESLVQHLQMELDSYRNKCHHLESHIIKLQQENEDIKMLEARIQELIQENQRLNAFIREKKLD